MPQQVLVDPALASLWPELSSMARTRGWELLDLGHREHCSGAPRVLSDGLGGATIDVVRRLRAQDAMAPIHLMLSRRSECLPVLPKLVLAGVDDIGFATERGMDGLVRAIDEYHRVSSAFKVEGDEIPPPDICRIAIGYRDVEDPVVLALLGVIARHRGAKRTGVQIADQVRSTVRTLNRHLHGAGMLPLGPLLRASMVAHGAWLHDQRGLAWADVAVALGFPSTEALNVFRSRVRYQADAEGSATDPWHLWRPQIGDSP